MLPFFGLKSVDKIQAQIIIGLLFGHNTSKWALNVMVIDLKH